MRKDGRVIELSAKEELARRMVCLPLDGLDSIDEVRERIEELSPFVGLFKVGKESFTRFGPEVISLVTDGGAEVFLDLKYHDIPNTVKGAAGAATGLGVAMFNVHASGGLAMMEAARIGVEEADSPGGKKPKVLAVTVLTSLDEEALNTECRIPGTVAEHVAHLTLLTEEAGLDGIVCSAADMEPLKNRMSPEFLFVTPGIRGTTTPAGEDQKRVLSPGRAVAAGSSLLVIGRAITAADDRQAAARDVLKDIAAVL